MNIQSNLAKIKQRLKRIPFVYNINAALKAHKNSKQLKSLSKYYSNKAKLLQLPVYDEVSIRKRVRAQLLARGVHVQPKPMGSLRIFWIGANYNQDMTGFLQGLKKFGEVVTFKNEEGEYGFLYPQIFNNRRAVEKAKLSNGRECLKQIKKASESAPINLVMGQMWADLIDAKVLAEIQSMGIPVVNVSMDDKLPCQWRVENGKLMGSVGLCGGLDLVLTTSPTVCSWYEAEGCAAIYWPLASDPNIFYPREEKKHDVVFVGGKYGLRAKLVKKIMQAGIKVAAFGPGWPNGLINHEKIAEVFGEAKIILGSGNVGYNKDVLTIKLRDFDATMSGALYITNRNPDLLRLFEEGKDIECYDSIEECIQKIKFYLHHKKKMQEIAAAGRKKARICHAWEKRIGDALKFIGLLGCEENEN